MHTASRVRSARLLRRYMSAVLRHVLLLQRDVPAAAKFYRDGLGLVVHVCTERWAELGNGVEEGGDVGSTGFASTGSTDSTGAGGTGSTGNTPPTPHPQTIIALKHVDSEAHRSTGYSPILSFTVRDLNKTVTNLLNAGASLDGPILYPTKGKVAALRTPDGHMLGLFEPAEGTEV